MPTYQYACTECGHQLEAVQSFSDASLTECPQCSGRLRKLFSAVGVVFKGSGFYRNDSRSGSNTSSGNGEKSTKSETSGGGESGSKSSESSGSSSDSSKGSGSDSSKSSGSGSSSSGSSGNGSSASGGKVASKAAS